MHLNLPEGNGADFFGAIAPHATHPVVKLSVEDVLPQIETCKTPMPWLVARKHLQTFTQVLVPPLAVSPAGTCWFVYLFCFSL